MSEAFKNVPWQVVGPILALQIALAVAAIISCIRAEYTNGPKWLWFAIIIFGGLLGSVVFFLFGRRND